MRTTLEAASERAAQLETELKRTQATLAQSWALTQRMLRPDAPPDLPNVEIAADHQPADGVGSDAWGWVMQPSGRLACFMSDVAGRGMTAALAALTLHTAIKMALRLGVTPSETLRSINAEVYPHYTDAMLLATAAVFTIDGTTGAVEHASAGHPPTLLRLKGTWQRWPATVPPLGVQPEITPETQTATLAPHDFVIVHSNGLADDLRNAVPTHIVDELQPAAAQAVAVAVAAAAKQQRGGHPPTDDQTLLVAHVIRSFGSA
ncbi:MAG: serine/threonine-protein phosphatase [Chloroflexi bacterium]|nr:serine/threonine-protein phosphatase [Chloroflexota bacterium]